MQLSASLSQLLKFLHPRRRLLKHCTNTQTKTRAHSYLRPGLEEEGKKSVKSPLKLISGPGILGKALKNKSLQPLMTPPPGAKELDEIP